MFASVHVVTGAAVASVVPNPLISVPLAFGSHFVLDSIPHWHDVGKGEPWTRTTIKVGISDLIASFVLAFYLVFSTGSETLVYGMVAGSIVDTDVVLYPFLDKRGWKKVWPKFISKLHRDIQNEIKNIWGLVTQAAIFLFSLFVVLN